MGVKVTIADGSGATVKVTRSGELVVASIAYDLAEFRELDLINTAYNFYNPKPGKQFVVTGILAFGDKQIGTTTNATVIIYEATSVDSLVVKKNIFQFEIGHNQSIPFSPFRILTQEGVWINAQTDDDDVHLNITGYYIDKI